MSRKRYRVRSNPGQAVIGLFIIPIFAVVSGSAFFASPVSPPGVFMLIWFGLLAAGFISCAVRAGGGPSLDDKIIEEFGDENGADSGPSVESRLKQAEDLRAKGLITEEEYASKRREILEEV